MSNRLRMAGLLILLALLAVQLQMAQHVAAAVFAPVLKWQQGGCRTMYCRTGWYASPAVADLDKDGKPEVVWADYRLVIVEGDTGNDKFITNSPGDGRSWPGVVVADINNDGSLDIVAAYHNGYVARIRGMAVISVVGRSNWHRAARCVVWL